MTNYDFIKKILGVIQPWGETRTDEQRYENLEATIKVVDKLLYDIYDVSKDANRHEASMAKAGKRAKAFLQQLADYIDES